MEYQQRVLQEKIQELKILCQRFEDMGINESYFNPPASDEEISNWEFTNGIAIPESYKGWLRFSNGSDILNQLTLLISLKDMKTMRPHVPNDLVLIGHLIGDGEILCFSKETGKIVRVFEGRRKEFDSFFEILVQIIRMAKAELGEDESSREIDKKLMDMLNTTQKGV